MEAWDDAVSYDKLVAVIPSWVDLVCTGGFDT